MKTEQLIDLLAKGAGAAPRAVAARRLVPASGLGALASALLALTVIGLAPLPVFALAGWWIKLAYAALLAAAAGWLTSRLGRPGLRAGAAAWGIGAVVGAMALAGTIELWASDPSQRTTQWLGHSWRTCPVAIVVLSLPALALALRALQGLAPTRPAVAGLAAGLFAGAVGACGYTVACSEVSMSFVVTWYSLGIGITGMLGALLGVRLLRW